MTATQLPAIPTMMRRRRRGRRRWRWWRRGRWRGRRYEMPIVMVAVMMADGSTVHLPAWRSALAPLGYPLAPYGSLGPHFVRRVCHSNPGDCDSRKSGDEFNLVHGMVPFYFRASPFSRLRNVRIVLSNFLTKLFQALFQRLSNRPFWYNIYVFGKTRNVDSEDSLRRTDRR
jgi:hypothetical protein